MSDGWRAPGFSGKKRLPVIRQTESAECGLACLAMVASYFGYQTNLNSLRLMHPVSLKGATLKGLICIAGRLGLNSRPLRVEMISMVKLGTPCILHWNMNHFVVLKSIKRNIFVIHDPASGERRCTYSEMSSNFTGIVLELAPVADFEQRKDQPAMKLRDMWGKPVGLVATLAQTLALSLILQLIVLAAPFYMQLVVDEVLSKFDTDLLVVLALGFGFLVLLQAGVTALRAYVILYISTMLGFQMVSNLFGHLMKLPLHWYEKRHVGDILSRFSSTRPIRDLFTEGLVAACIDGLMAASTLLLIFIYSNRLGAIVIAVLLSYLLIRLALYRPFRQRSEDQIVAISKEQSTFIESVRGIQSIKIFGHETERQSVWQNKYVDVINSNIRIGKLRIGFDAANSLLFGFENILIIYCGAMLVTEGSLTLGMLIALIAYKRQFVDKATLLVERLIEFRLLGLHLERVADIGLAHPERGIEYPARGIAAEIDSDPNNGKIEFENVSFRYAEEEPWILRQISLVIEKGKLISFTGPSGSGKTSLMKLLLGLFSPVAGEILYSGSRLQKFGLARYRSRIGTVMQDDTLLAGSIADNISFFDTAPVPGKVQHCAQQASIHTDIAAMPMGYNSLVGDMGCALSAGQKQRVLLARALYRDPEILILDEGTANLDSTTEANVIHMLKQLKMTRICVAHREAMILASDRVFDLHAGAIRELNPLQLPEIHPDQHLPAR